MKPRSRLGNNSRAPPFRTAGEPAAQCSAGQIHNMQKKGLDNYPIRSYLTFDPGLQDPELASL